MKYLILFLTLLTLKVSAQTTGTITDAATHEPLPGVAITDAANKGLTKTNTRGKFTLPASVNGTIRFSMIGYNTKQISLPASTQTLNINLDNKTFLGFKKK